jgi:putative DNA primase/helicase
LNAAHIDFKAGQGVRIIDLPFTGAYGIFDDLHGKASGSIFADSLRNAAATHYGFAGPAFVEWLIQHDPQDLQNRLRTILSKIMPPGVNAQEERVARSFALVALAGEMALEAGVLPWEVDTVITSVGNIFNYWRISQPKSATSKEHAQVLLRLSDFTESLNDSGFSDINWKPETNIHGYVTNKERSLTVRYGYWDDISRVERGNKGIRFLQGDQSVSRGRGLYHRQGRER